MIIVECSTCKKRYKVANGGMSPMCHDKYMAVLGEVRSASLSISGSFNNPIDFNSNDWINNLTEKDFITSLASIALQSRIDSKSKGRK